MYERLFQLHHYFEPEPGADDAVVWHVLDCCYVLHARDMKAWQIKQPDACGNGPVANVAAASVTSSRLASLLGRPVRHVVSI
jgi:hypothetical protein